MVEGAEAFEVDEASFGERVVEKSHAAPVLVDFWAAWCAPCRALAPILEAVVESLRGRVVLAKVDSDRNQDLALRYNVRSLPTVMLFRRGQVVDQFVGAQPESRIRAFLEPHLARDSDRHLATAAELWDGGDSDGAIEALHEGFASDPDNPRLRQALIECLISARRLEEAERALEDAPPKLREEEPFKRLTIRLEFSKLASESPPEDELRAVLEREPANSAARYRLAMRQLAEARYEPGMDELLELLRRDRGYGDGAARKKLLSAFELLGGDGPLVSQYRNRLSSLLY